MFYIYINVFLCLLFIFFVCFFYYTGSSRLFFFLSTLYCSMNTMVTSHVGHSLLLFFFFFLLSVNLIGNIPLAFIPTIFYSFTITFSLVFWLPIIICVSISQLNDFLAHMLPYGSPLGLILFLPLVEIFSQIIRPITLIIRLSTNLSAGHIMMYMFSYFTLLSAVLSPFIYTVLFLLFILELCISALQAYIFISLIVLYVNETV